MNRFLVLAAALGLTLSACDSTTDPGPSNTLDVQTASNIVAAPTTGRDPTTGAAIGPKTFTLYSLRENRVVLNYDNPVRTDSATTNWDIGFNGTAIIVNGGTSGPGRSQAVVVAQPFSSVTAVPAGTTFRTDGSTTDCGTHQPRAICEGSNNPNGFYLYDQPNNLILPIAGRTILVRTADGAGYAKVQIRSYYQNAPAAPVATTDQERYYTFDYVLNPSGTSFAAAQ